MGIVTLWCDEYVGVGEGVRVKAAWIIGQIYWMCYNQAQDLGNSYVMRCQILIIFFVSLR
jgi:hypothetical protein